MAAELSRLREKSQAKREKRVAEGRQGKEGELIGAVEPLAVSEHSLIYCGWPHGLTPSVVRALTAVSIGGIPENFLGADRRILSDTLDQWLSQESREVCVTPDFLGAAGRGLGLGGGTAMLR